MPHSHLRPRMISDSIVVYTGVAAAYAAAFALPPAIPELDRAAGLSHTEAGLVLGVFTLSFAVTSPAAAGIARSYPRRSVIPCSVVGAGGLAAVLGAAPPIGILVAARAAVGFAVAVALLSGLVAADSGGASVGWVLASVNIGVAAAFVVIPVLGSATSKLTSLEVIGLAISSLGVALGFASRGFRHPSSAVNPAARNHATGQGPHLQRTAATTESTVLVILLCCALFGLYGVLTWYPPFLTEQEHLQNTALAVTAAGMAIAAVPASLLAARSLRRGTHPMVVTAVGFAMGGSIVTLAVAHLTSPQVVGAIGLVSVCGLSVTLVPLYAVIRPGLLGRANMLAYSSAMVAVWLGGVLVGAGKDYSSAFAVFATVAVIAASVALAARLVGPTSLSTATSDDRSRVNA